jgi:hypothetical protein
MRLTNIIVMPAYYQDLIMKVSKPMSTMSRFWKAMVPLSTTT